MTISHAQALKERRNGMKIVTIKTGKTVTLKWVKAPASKFSEAEYIAWKHQWIGLIRNGFDKLQKEYAADLSKMKEGQAALDACIEVLKARNKQRSEGGG